MLRRKVVWLCLVVALLVGGCAVLKINSKGDDYPQSAQFSDGVFHNNPPIALGGLKMLPKLLVRSFTEEVVDQKPDWELPVEPLSTADIENLPDDEFSIIKLGHSTLILKVEGQLWLIDPVFSKRASPFTRMGPKRFHQPPISIDELPMLDGVLISHNHYDHLDKQSIIALRDKSKHFLVPLGLASLLEEWGVAKSKILELDWWQSKQFDGVEMTATPAQHFSGRGLFDRNCTLWNSWAINARQANIYYSGDSGYFAGFKKIGDQLGPFDVTLLEVGAYDRAWPTVHMMPNQAIKAHQDLRGEVLIPVHNGTFDLAYHPWHEPIQRMYDLGQESNVRVQIPRFGQVFTATTEVGDDLWWTPPVSIASN